MKLQLPERDGDGYLVDSSVWTSEIAHAMAQADDVELDVTKWQQILKAREYYEEHAVVPPFASFLNTWAQTRKRCSKCG